MKRIVLKFEVFFLIFFLLLSCSSDIDQKKTVAITKVQKKTVIPPPIKITVDQFLDDYASVICGKEPTVYFKSVCNTSAWKELKQRIDSEWGYVTKNKVNKIKPWADSIMPKVRVGDNLIYPFAGADFLYANLFYENADSVVMIGLENPGDIMADTTDSKKFLGHVSKVYKALYFSNHMGFFRTISMRNELNDSELSGTIPGLLFYIRKMGYSISSLKHFQIDTNGALSSINSKQAFACKIEYFNQDNKLRCLFYVKYDLSDNSLIKDKRMVLFLDKFSKPNVLIKSASYLLHSKNFSVMKDYILKKSNCILQDDTGLPYRFFESTEWDVNLFGTYTKVIPLFSGSFQADLRDAFKTKGKGELPFSIGYNINHGEPNLILSSRKK